MTSPGRVAPSTTPRTCSTGGTPPRVRQSSPTARPIEHIAAGGGVHGRSWEFSVGWSCTDREIDAIHATPQAVWQNATDQDGAPLDDTWVADITGLLDLSEWTEKIPGLRIIARDEPLHPKSTPRASYREKARGRRYQLIAVNARTGQVAWLDARHRSHVHVEDDVKQAKAIEPPARTPPPAVAAGAACFGRGVPDAGDARMSLDHVIGNRPGSTPAALAYPTVPAELPDVLLGLFERRYLTDFESSRWDLRAWPDDAGRPVFAEVEAIGRTPAERTGRRRCRTCSPPATPAGTPW